jgi:hypothetical protein
VDFAAFYRTHDEIRLAEWLEHQLHGDPADLPRRVRAMFGHGMGGLLDAAGDSVEARTERGRLAQAGSRGR